MVSKKLLLAGVLSCGLLAAAPVAAAPITTVSQTVYDPGDINSILEDNLLRDTATRYMAVYSFFFPEEASRLGFSSVRNTLNDRSLETDAQALQALEAIQTSLNEISEKRLSDAKIAEYHLFKNTVANQIWTLEQNRLARDPLYYTQALDALYDLLLFTSGDTRQRYRDLMGRLSALPKVTAQAKQNLTDTPSQRARLAMEKAYYAYLSFDELDKIISDGTALTNDPREAQQAKQKMRQAKTAIKEMFELFKSLSQQEDFFQDFRMEPEEYAHYLKKQYQISGTQHQLAKQLDRHFKNAQKELWKALQPFELSAETEEVTVVEDLNEPPQNEAYTAPETKSKPVKKQKPVYTPPTAGQFYALASQLQSPFTVDNLLEDVNKQASTWGAKLVRSKVLPAAMSFNLKPLPKYFAYQQLAVKIPAVKNLFVRIPDGNKQAKQEALDRDFNAPALHLFISQELVPGHYYQTYSMTNGLRRVLGSPTLANGWADYALQIAQEQDYFLTDEERLFVAWHKYQRALKALLDQRVHTRRYSYDEAINFLTNEQGFTAEQAAAILNEIVRAPGEAVSYLTGLQVWQKASAPYKRKLKDASKVNALLLQAGNVLPEDLPNELKRLSQKK